MKINLKNIAIYVVMSLPLITLPPYFFPPDFAKSIIFRSIMAVLLFVALFGFLKQKTNTSTAVEVLKTNKIAWLLGGLFLVYAVSTLFSIDWYFSLWGSPNRGGGFVTFAFLIAFAVYSYLNFKKDDWKRYWDFSIIIGLMVSLIATLQYFHLFAGILTSTYDNRPSSTIGNPIMMGMYLLLLFFPTLAFLLKEANKTKMYFYGASLAVFAWTILISGSRACWLAMVLGLILFLLSYPKKLKSVKIATGFFAIIVLLLVIYANAIAVFPDNQFFKSIGPRLSVQKFLEDARFPAWTVGAKAITQKPWSGYGMENFYVGFDKNYQPSVGIEWWDRAHNILIQTASDAGILATVIYIALFVVLLWQLQKVAASAQDYGEPKDKILARGLQCALVAYFIANQFSFDQFPTYLLFFFMIGWTMALSSPLPAKNIKTRSLSLNAMQKTVMGILGLGLAVFLWQYNVYPFFLNAQINKAEAMANAKQCDASLLKMDALLKNRSFLDSYNAIEYVQMTKTCNGFFPGKNAQYMQAGAEKVQEAIKIQPAYTRFWMAMGAYENYFASQEKDNAKKQELYMKARGYLAKAEEMAPQSEEVLKQLADTYTLQPDYKELLSIFVKLAQINAKNAQYHSTLAFLYAQNQDYGNARKEAEVVLELQPEARQNVEEFLKVLPK